MIKPSFSFVPRTSANLVGCVSYLGRLLRQQTRSRFATTLRSQCDFIFAKSFIPFRYRLPPFPTSGQASPGVPISYNYIYLANLRICLCKQDSGTKPQRGLGRHIQKKQNHIVVQSILPVPFYLSSLSSIERRYIFLAEFSTKSHIIFSITLPPPPLLPPLLLCCKILGSSYSFRFVESKYSSF